MWGKLFFLLAVPAALAFASDGHLEETSFEFLDKLTVKQRQNIVSLKISNASIEKINPKLKYLKNLEYLDLSNNNIHIHSIPSLPTLKVLKLSDNYLKQIQFKQLPKNLEELDLSDNLLAQIPEDWKYLKNLKRLHLNKNQISCECANVLKYKDLLKNNIALIDGVLCNSPKAYKGKNIDSINCSIEDIMLNDEGSGDGEVEADATNLTGVAIMDELEEDVTEVNAIVNDKNDLPPETTTDEETEGSGHEGPDVVCHIDCETPSPIKNDNSAGPPPFPLDQAKMLLEDLNILNTQPPATTSSPTTLSPVPVTEVFSKVVNNNTQKGELERASLAPISQNSSTVYIVVGVCVLLAVVFILLFVRKRRSRAALKQTRLEAADDSEEMKPMNKPVIDTVNEKGAPPESVPLINGNGKAHEDVPTLKTFAPIPSDQEEVDDEAAEIRKKAAPELLTPQRERVTIRASEIPDSLPKTPVLVHRQKTSDGNIVTTPVSSS